MFLLANLRLYFKFLIVIITIAVVIAAIILNKIPSEYESPKINDIPEVPKKVYIFTDQELAQYNGIQQERIYLSVIGSVFDVTKGRKHYKKGASYHYFAGKDGSRALVTGDFNDESSNKDYVLDLNCDDIFNILHWRRTFREKYEFIGYLSGRYYDENGAETMYMTGLKKVVKQCREEKEEAKNKREYSHHVIYHGKKAKGLSGGIVRNWVGVPRQLYTPGVERPQCVCVSRDNSSLIKEYEGCPSTSTECIVPDK
ncbi:putative cytochrome b5 domain containing 2 [Danaus plexippus plexippus]|uniref:Cytochrome b5 domain containing 2 n=1 Tax=Danaus plexippus plexippus TaxID=278856 RepID=A0A212EY94_DANPL|nr:putative cytochrome b5 domain containing 2 [Danaus plexippus plexippus]